MTLIHLVPVVTKLMYSLLKLFNIWKFLVTDNIMCLWLGGIFYDVETFIAFLCIITYHHLTSCNNLGSVIGCHAELATVGGGLDEGQDSVQYN